MVHPVPESSEEENEDCDDDHEDQCEDKKDKKDKRARKHVKRILAPPEPIVTFLTLAPVVSRAELQLYTDCDEEAGIECSGTEDYETQGGAFFSVVAALQIESQVAELGGINVWFRE